MNKIKTYSSILSVVFVAALVMGLLFPIQVSAASQIRITEIMYDPSGNGDKEFVEFYNGSDTAVALGGWSTFGVDFIFPSGTTLSPGGYIAIARNLAALRASHPSARIAGEYGGKLRGGGETVKLLNAGGQVVSQVSYLYGGFWPSAPRNGGPSLSLIRTTANESLAACWAPSSSLGGSPGVANGIQGGFGGGCSDVAYPVSSIQPRVGADTQTPAAQAKAAEAKKQEEAQKAEEKKVAEQKLAEQKQEEIKVAQAKAVQQAKVAEQTKKAANQKRWIVLAVIILFILAGGLGVFILLRAVRKKNVAQILSKGSAPKKQPGAGNVKA